MAESHQEHCPADPGGTESRMRMSRGAIVEVDPTECRGSSACAQVCGGGIPQTREQSPEAIAGLDEKVVVPFNAIFGEGVQPASDDSLLEHTSLQPHEAGEFVLFQGGDTYATVVEPFGDHAGWPFEGGFGDGIPADQAYREGIVDPGLNQCFGRDGLRVKEENVKASPSPGEPAQSAVGCVD